MENNILKARKEGVCHFKGDDTACVVYAVYSRKDVETVLGEPLAGLRYKDMSEAVVDITTGWCREPAVIPGGSFRCDPIVKVYKHAVAIFQRRGIDV